MPKKRPWLTPEERAAHLLLLADMYRMAARRPDRREECEQAIRNLERELAFDMGSHS